MPVYFVEEELLRAVDATKPPPDLTLEQINMPMPAMLFMFPVKFMVHRHRWPFAMSAVTKLNGGAVKTNRWFKQIAGVNVELGSQGSMMLFHFPLYLEDGNPVDYASRYPIHHKLSDLSVDEAYYEDCSIKEREKYNQIKPGLGDFIVERKVPTPSHEDDVGILKELTVLTSKLLLVLGARPGLITTGSITRKEKRKGSIVVREELWSPNMIGSGYKIQRQSEDHGGTHASPRMHWRRGHMHTVVHGEGRSLRKLQWFEPVLVNSHKDQ
jgi:hypothetical protein